MKTRALKWIWPVLIVVLVAGPAAAEVSIDEILRLHNAGLSAQSLLLVVEASDTPDTISTDQLTALLEAGVPDTVITVLVYQADAVAEDWEPVDVDEGVEEYRVVTQTRYVNHDYYDYYDPGWTFSVGVWWGNPYYWSYWDRPLYCDPWYDPWYGGWCATSWYSYGGYYDPWYHRPRVCIGFGWFPFRYAWNPYNYGYHHGGYYAYYDHDYYDRGIYGRVRDAARPDYRNTVNRSIVDGSGGKSYRGITTDRRGDAPLTTLTRDYVRPTKDVYRDQRTALRDLGDTRQRTDKDLSGREIEKRSSDLPRLGDKETSRYDRKAEDLGLKSYARDKSREAATDKDKVTAQDRKSTPPSMFDRYGDEAKSTAEKVERYRALKQSERSATRDQSKSTDRTDLRSKATTPDRGTALRSYPGSRGGTKARVTPRAVPPKGDAATSGRKPAKVDTKKDDPPSEKTAAPATRSGSPTRIETKSPPSSSSSRSSGARKGDGGTKRTGSTTEGKSSGRKP